ncbi:hypothetical protein L6164_016355 [Bauhinia variegata]|uniref:Uncharacterized protein n=1 Tax=Bauhinia variegata TaxID=167791 RepID=A0ACB9NQS4_BAUVA|nr:hypothetical protein L6164_016355 [Bauhinia variegata]
MCSQQVNICKNTIVPYCQVPREIRRWYGVQFNPIVLITMQILPPIKAVRTKPPTGAGAIILDFKHKMAKFFLMQEAPQIALYSPSFIIAAK